jgi:hypothetical protein
MKIIVEVTKEELKEANFTDEEHMRECIIGDLDDARAYPGFNIKVVVTDD